MAQEGPTMLATEDYTTARQNKDYITNQLNSKNKGKKNYQTTSLVIW
jgi:hypothetical protein